MVDSSAAESPEEGSSERDSPTTGRLRRFSVSAGPAQAMAQMVIDMDKEVPDKDMCEPWAKDDIIQALSNAGNEFKTRADEKKGEHYGVREVAEKWNDIAGTGEEHFNNCGKSQLIELLRLCLNDIRYLKEEETTYISNDRITI
jgi:hypothetical protein